MKNRVLVFGAGGIGIKAKNLLEQENYVVTAFADNNELRWGEKIEGCSIIAPSKIVSSDYDLFAIGIYKAKEVVKRQLLSLGIPEERIIVPIEAPQVTTNKSIKFSEKFFGNKIAVAIGDNIADKYCLDRGDLIDSWDFANNFWAFMYLVEDILAITESSHVNSWWKCHSVADYDNLNVTFYKVDDNFKIDQSLVSKIIVSDAIALENLAYSKNTFSFWKNRLPRKFDFGFIEKIELLKKTLHEKNIPLEEVAVVSGAVLQAYGLRDESFADDIDIIMTERFRELYGKGLVIVSDCVEMHPFNEMKLGISKLDISDESIIEDNDNHFYFRGVKFCLLHFLYNHRCYVGDFEEIKLMEWFGCRH